jgi:hypothetical protein
VRTYRPGLWFLAAGLVANVCLWVVITTVAQLQQTGEIELTSMTAFEVIGYADIAATLMLVTGATLCAIGSPSGRRRNLFIAVAVLFASYRVLEMSPWLLSLCGVHVSMQTYRGLTLGMSAVFVAAFSVLALVAYEGIGSKRLGKYALIVVAIRGVWFLFTNSSRRDVLGEGNWSNAIEGLLGLAVLLSGTAVVFDMLGAFKDSEQRAPDARLRDQTRGISTFVAIAVAFLGIGLAALALWGTKRTSSVDATKLTLIHGTLLFMGAAIALRALQHREVHLERFAAATLVVIVAGRVALGAYASPVQHVELETHALPGLSIGLPAGKTEAKYQYRELGKLTIMSRHADLGLVELAWSEDERDPIEEYGNSNTKSWDIEIVPIADRGRDVQITGYVWSMQNLTRLWASWKCPHDRRWYLLSISRYSPGVEPIHEVAKRIFETGICNGAEPFPFFHVPAPSDVETTWATQLDPREVLRQAGMDPDRVETLNVAPTTPSIPAGIVESETRTVYEQMEESEYRIVTMWHCYTMNIDVAWYAKAEPARRDTLLAAVRSAHCPR